MFYGNYPQGEVIDHDIVESVINSTERMTYNNVNKILAGDKNYKKSIAMYVIYFS